MDELTAKIPGRAVRATTLLTVLLLGFLLRVYTLPGRYEQRNIDEPAYVASSLLLIEGVTPGHHAVPGGLQFWAQWMYVGFQGAWNLFHPIPEEAQLGLKQGRPLYALDRAIFDNYRDISHLRNFTLWCNIGYGLLAIAAAWKFGDMAGGFYGALAAGGMIAFLPIYVDLAGTSRPHIAALSMVVLCVIAVTRSRGLEQIGPAAVFFGLAVGTRIEMGTVLPLIAAIAITDAGWIRGIRRLVIFGIYALVTFMAIAPWWLMTLFGNIRSIVGSRFQVGVVGGVSTGDVVVEFLFLNALLVPTLLMFLSWRRAIRIRHGWVIPAAATLIFGTMLAGGNNAIAYQTPVVMTVILIAAMGVQELPARMTRPVLVALLVSFACAAGFSIRQTMHYKAAYVPDEAADWVEAHVPPGTRVYWPHGLSKLPLPTEAAATAMWDEMMNDDGWRRKTAWALQTPNDWKRPLPRSTSDEIMLKERANVRLWFILGGRPEVKAPRFDIRQHGSSLTFGVRDPIGDFQKTGGVLVWRGDRPTQLGEPEISWTKNQTSGTFIYVAPELKPQLIP